MHGRAPRSQRRAMPLCNACNSGTSTPVFCATLAQAMPQNLFTALYRGQPAQFRSHLPMAQAARNLRLLTLCEASATLRECISGTVDDDGEVHLWREIYQWSNSFAPHFYGEFSERDGETYLEGSFKPPLFVRALMAYAMFIVFMAGGTLAYHMTQMRAWPFLAGFVAVVLVVFSIALMGRSASSSDPEAISKTIRQALAGG